MFKFYLCLVVLFACADLQLDVVAPVVVGVDDPAEAETQYQIPSWCAAGCVPFSHYCFPGERP